MGSGHNGISARLYNSWGWALGAEFQVDTSGSTSLFEPEVTALANGGFVVSWADWNGVDIKARIFDSAGSAAGAEFRLNTNVAGTQDGADITALANGGFVAAWRTTDSTRTAAPSGQGAIFDASGVRVGAEFLVNTKRRTDNMIPATTALAPAVASSSPGRPEFCAGRQQRAVKAQYSLLVLESGLRVPRQHAGRRHPARSGVDRKRRRLVVAWTNSSSQDGSGFSIKAQAFDSAGASSAPRCWSTR